MEAIKINDLDILKLKNGDTVLFKLPETAINEGIVYMLKQIRGILLEQGIESIFLNNDIEITVLRKVNKDD